MQFRWLSVAGIELTYAGRVLLLDPFISRFPLHRLWRPQQSDAALLAQHIPQANFILITHAHWDHLFDVPALSAQTGGDVYGSRNTARLLQAAGVPIEHIHHIAGGEQLELDPFHVTVLPAEHMTVLGRIPLQGRLKEPVRPPRYPWHYKMDISFSFLIEASGVRWLYWNGVLPGPAPAADVLFILPYGDSVRLAPLLAAVRPRWIVPIHWDDFLRPLTAPPRPSFAAPRWGWPPVQRIQLAHFTAQLAQLAPEAQVFIPQRFTAYAFDPQSAPEAQATVKTAAHRS